MESTVVTATQSRSTTGPAGRVHRHSLPRPRNAGRPRLRRLLLSMSPTSWVCLDILIIGLATLAAQTALLLTAHGYGWIANPWLASTAFCVSITLAGIVFGLYERPTLLSRGRIVFRSVMSLALGVVLAFACLSLLFYAHASRWVGVSVGLTYLALAVPLRLLAHEVVTSSRVRLLCVGTGESIRRLVGILGNIHNREYHVVGHVRASREVEWPPAWAARAPRASGFRSAADDQFAEDCPCLGGLADVAALVADRAVDEIVVAPELAVHPAVGQVMAACLEGRCRVTDQPTFVEKLLGEVPAESITAAWFLRADVQNHGSYEAAKRIMDLLVAACGLLATLPLWPLIALAIWLDSRGTLFFKQARAGQHGRCFTIYKFRTMRPDAERDGARWAQRHDTRVTRVGRFLRHTRLDELPQLLNVLRGDMALVGPRPERPEFVRNLEQLLPHYRLRHLVKPGVTGWAQIHYGYGASVADAHRKLCYDLYYLKHRSLDLDLAILIRTFGTFLLGAH